MNAVNKFLTLTFIFLLLSSLLVFTASPVIVQAASKPQVPEFTLQFVDNSYDVPPTFSKDPFTGETIITKEGYRADNRTIEVKIKNQPFTPYTDSQGNSSFLWHDIRWKGHFDDYWYTYSSRYGNHYLGAASEYNSDGSLHAILPYSDVTYFIGTGSTTNIVPHGFLGNVSDGGQIDFQVKAFIGYYNRVVGPPDDFTHRPTESLVFTGESSSWSRTQTITIGVSNNNNSSNGNQNSSSSDQNPNASTNSAGDQPKNLVQDLSLVQSGLIVAVAVLLILLIVITFFYSKKVSLDFNDNQGYSGKTNVCIQLI